MSVYFHFIFYIIFMWVLNLEPGKEPVFVLPQFNLSSSVNFQGSNFLRYKDNKVGINWKENFNRMILIEFASFCYL